MQVVPPVTITPSSSAVAVESRVTFSLGSLDGLEPNMPYYVAVRTADSTATSNYVTGAICGSMLGTSDGNGILAAVSLQPSLSAWFYSPGVKPVTVFVTRQPCWSSGSSTVSDSGLVAQGQTSVSVSRVLAHTDMRSLIPQMLSSISLYSR